MAKLEVKNLDGAKVGDIDLDETVFGAEVNEHLLWEVVKAQRAKKRAGTHSTLRRSEVRGGGKKPYKQKGTGNARQGSTRAPHYVGGGGVLALIVSACFATLAGGLRRRALPTSVYAPDAPSEE